MKPKTNKRKTYEKELLYYLDLYNELRGREGTQKIINFISEEIDRLVELLKEGV